MPHLTKSEKPGTASPRSLALIGVGIASGKILSPQDFRKQFNKWIEEMPEEVYAEFREAYYDILSWDTNQERWAFQQFQTANKQITDFLAECLLTEESPGVAKVRGAVFTPNWLARRVTRNSLAHWRRLHRTGRAPSIIADVSCGCGAFLYAIHETFGSSNRVIGVDSHSGSIAYATLLKWGLGASWELRCEDSLMSAPHLQGLLGQSSPETIRDGYDLLVGNPPYVRSSSLSREYSKKLRRSYSVTSTGNYDLSIAFLEHALQTLAPDGIASYIVTNKFMSSSYGREICNRIALNARIINIEDFQDSQIFPGYTTYTCVLTFAKKSPAARFTVTRFPQGIESGSNPGPGDTISLPSERLITHPWDFATGPTHEALRLLRDPRHPLLSEVFGKILQGVRTGANPIFVIPTENSFNIESDVLIPFVSGEHIRRCKVEAEALRLIFPYRIRDFGDVVPIDEPEFKMRYPNCWEYINQHRGILEERSFSSRNHWYSYSRSQNLDFALRPKLLVREMMPRAEFAADTDGKIAFCSGYGLDAARMDTSTLKLWTAIMCTPTMEFSLRHNGTQLHSGWFRLLKHHLRRVRLPKLHITSLKQAESLSAELHQDPHNEEKLQALDDIVADSFQLEPSHRTVIIGYLKDCHRRSLPSKNRLPQVENDKLTYTVETQDDRSVFEPVSLHQYKTLHRDRPDLQKLVTFVPNKNRPIHRWYQYTQGFSADLVEKLIEELGVNSSDVVLDPFAGCGTTGLVCRQQGIPSINIDISPLAVWIAKGKVAAWRPTELKKLLDQLTWSPPTSKVVHESYSGVFDTYLSKAFFPTILNQLWAYFEAFENEQYASRHIHFLNLGLISIMEEVSNIRKHGSHYRYMLKSENVGLQKLNIQIVGPSLDIAPILRERLYSMVEDVRQSPIPRPAVECKIIQCDARSLELPDDSVSAVITSPPYLNRNNYIAQQKAELAILSMVKDTQAYRALVRSTFRSHVESSFDKTPVTQFAEVQAILDAMTLTERNNPKIPHMIAGYFEDLNATLGELSRVIKPGGVAAFVIGNSRWGGVVVPVDHLLLMIAENNGFIPERVLVTRLKGNSPQQMRQFGRIPVRESIVVFRKC